MALTISDLYHSLFGKNHITDGDVISFSEHSRVGNVSTGDGYKRVGIQETEPTNSTKNNGSLVLTYDGSDQITNIALTVGATTYNKTLTWVSGNCTAVSVWT